MGRTAIFPKDRQGAYEQYGYSAAISSGGFLFVSGQVGVRTDGTVIEDPREQIAQAFENLKQVLAAADCSLDDIVDITSFHVDMHKHFEAFGEVKQEIFPVAPFPNWTAIGVTTLVDPALIVEIKVVAKLP
jgi:enamine deaminase RidA (YjgF/YER057c/UK114 family)